MTDLLPSPTDVLTRKIAVWFEGKQEFEILPFIFFVSSANAAQQSFQFYFPNPPDGLTYEVAGARQAKGEPVLVDGDGTEPYDVLIFITSKPLEGNHSFIELGQLVRVSTHGWKGNSSPPSVFEYLFHCMMCGAIYALTTVRSHDQFTMGCQFEYTRVKELDRVDIALGFVCQEHQRIIASELGNGILSDAEFLFKFSWLGGQDDQGTVSFKMKNLFNCDLKKDSGYRKKFLERVEARLEGRWFDVTKELIRGIVLIFVAYLLFKYGLRPSR
jgi:hypothetical protein